MADLVFREVRRGGGHLRGYLFSEYPEDEASHLLENWKFEEIIARLYTLGKRSGQSIFGGEYRSTFEITGTYKTIPFCLYDWCGDRGIHIGGSDELDVTGLIEELVKVIEMTEPTPFRAKSPYSDEIYSYGRRRR